MLTAENDSPVRSDADASWRIVLHSLARDRSAVLGLVVLVLIAAIALAAPYVAPYDPIDHLDVLGLRNHAPSLQHPFGTDEKSRDVLSRVIHGGRISLRIAFLSVLLSATVGAAYGAIAGYVGGLVDSAMMRMVDAMLAIPRVLLLIAVATLWNGLGLDGLILLLGLTGWFAVSRLVRSLVRSAREDEFVTAARALGATDARILIHHILPRIVSPVLVAATLGIGNVIVIEAGLTYLGVGVREPHASWGNVFKEGMENMSATWWVWSSAGIAVVITVLATNLVADGLRQALSGRQLPAR